VLKNKKPFGQSTEGLFMQNLYFEMRNEIYHSIIQSVVAASVKPEQQQQQHAQLIAIDNFMAQKYRGIEYDAIASEK